MGKDVVKHAKHIVQTQSKLLLHHEMLRAFPRFSEPRPVPAAVLETPKSSRCPGQGDGGGMVGIPECPRSL